MSSEKRAPGWLFEIGDEKLPSYIEIVINHEIRIPFSTNQDSMESKGPRVSFMAHVSLWQGRCSNQVQSTKSPLRVLSMF